jgi:hypothetical protein
MASVHHVISSYTEQESWELEPGPYRSVEESLEWLAVEGTMNGERERILTSTVILLSKGHDLRAALETAIVWERG